MIKNFSSALKNYGKAINFIFKNNLAWTFLLPLILIFFLLAGSFGASSAAIDSIDLWLETNILSNESTWYFKLLNSVVFSLVWVIFKVMFFFIFAYFSGFIILIILSPIFSYISEKTDKILTGNDYPFSIGQTIKDIWRGIVLALRNMISEFLFVILFFTLSFVPLLGILAPFALFFVTAYFYGFSFMDYSNERKQLSVSESVKTIKANKGAAIGNGFVFALVLLIPYIGAILAGFAAIIAVVAAAITTNSEKWKEVC